jgi:hypothetical protein
MRLRFGACKIKLEGIGLQFVTALMTSPSFSAYNDYHVVARGAHKLESTMEDTSL